LEKKRLSFGASRLKLIKRIRLIQKKIKQKLFSESDHLLYTREVLGDRYLIGDHTYGKPRVISRGEGRALTIGKYCSISTRVLIFLGSEHRADWISTYPFPVLWREASSIKGHPSSKGDVRIGNDVYIGYHVIILSGVTVGDGAVIGAGSVVASDVPPYAIAAGNPAHVLRYRFDGETIKKLLEIKWWDWSDEKVKENVHLICSDKVDAFIKKFG
jgi:acetyltransferase-like isoleucine patch superfamily enzyme